MIKWKEENNFFVFLQETKYLLRNLRRIQQTRNGSSWPMARRLKYHTTFNSTAVDHWLKNGSQGKKVGIKKKKKEKVQCRTRITSRTHTGAQNVHTKWFSNTQSYNIYSNKRTLDDFIPWPSLTIKKGRFMEWISFLKCLIESRRRTDLLFVPCTLSFNIFLHGENQRDFFFLNSSKKIFSLFWLSKRWKKL